MDMKGRVSQEQEGTNSVECFLESDGMRTGNVCWTEQHGVFGDLGVRCVTGQSNGTSLESVGERMQTLNRASF